MNSFSIDLMFDASPSIGMGHYKRCLAIRNRLKKKNIKVNMIGLSSKARELVPDDDDLVGRAQVVLYDSCNNLDDFLQKDRKKNRKTIALDYFGQNIPDIAIGVQPEKKPLGLISSYCGLKFHIIRDEFRSISYEYNEQYDLVVIGAGDINQQSGFIARAAKINGLPIKLVLGPYAKNLNIKDKDIEILMSPNNMAELYARSRIVHSNGGGCMLEAMFFSKPVVAWPQSEPENQLANYVKNINGILGIGLEGIAAIEKSSLERVGRTAGNVIDGRGLDRVCKIILDAFKMK